LHLGRGRLHLPAGAGGLHLRRGLHLRTRAWRLLLRDTGGLLLTRHGSLLLAGRGSLPLSSRRSLFGGDLLLARDRGLSLTCDRRLLLCHRGGGQQTAHCCRDTQLQHLVARAFEEWIHGDLLRNPFDLQEQFVDPIQDVRRG
jgi:hypothetical protein